MFGGVRPVGKSRGQSVEADAEIGELVQDVCMVGTIHHRGRYHTSHKANLLPIFL